MFRDFGTGPFYPFQSYYNVILVKEVRLPRGVIRGVYRFSAGTHFLSVVKV